MKQKGERFKLKKKKKLKKFKLTKLKICPFFEKTKLTDFRQDQFTKRESTNIRDQDLYVRYDKT